MRIPRRILDKVWQIGTERFAQGVPCKPGLKELLALLESRGMPRIVASSSPRNMIEQNLQTTRHGAVFPRRGLRGRCETQQTGAGYLPGGGPPPEAGYPRLPGAGGQLQRGVRAGHAAGAVTVMVPDLAQPDEEIRQLYTCCCHDLLRCGTCSSRGKL